MSVRFEFQFWITLLSAVCSVFVTLHQFVLCSFQLLKAFSKATFAAENHLIVAPNYVRVGQLQFLNRLNIDINYIYLKLIYWKIDSDKIKPRSLSES